MRISRNHGLASISRTTSASAVKGRQEISDVSVMSSPPGEGDMSDEDERGVGTRDIHCGRTRIMLLIPTYPLKRTSKINRDH